VHDAVDAPEDLAVQGTSMSGLVKNFEDLIDKCLSAGDCTELLARNRHFEV